MSPGHIVDTVWITVKQHSEREPKGCRWSAHQGVWQPTNCLRSSAALTRPLPACGNLKALCCDRCSHHFPMVH